MATATGAATPSQAHSGSLFFGRCTMHPDYERCCPITKELILAASGLGTSLKSRSPSFGSSPSCLGSSRAFRGNCCQDWWWCTTGTTGERPLNGEVVLACCKICTLPPVIGSAKAPLTCSGLAATVSTKAILGCNEVAAVAVTGSVPSAGICPKLDAAAIRMLPTARHDGVKGGVQGWTAETALITGDVAVVELANAEPVCCVLLPSRGVELRSVGVVMPEVMREAADVDGVWATPLLALAPCFLLNVAG